MEVSRLEKRLTKLTQLLANPPGNDTSNNGFLWSVGLLKNQRRQLEQKVVAWEDDTGVTNCPFCKQTFSKLGVRKHHCRLCGRVVCGDLRTGCSNEVGLNVTNCKLISRSSMFTVVLYWYSMGLVTLRYHGISWCRNWTNRYMRYFIDFMSTAFSEKHMSDLSLDVRMCKECKATVFAKKDFAVDVAQRPPEVRAYTVCFLLYICFTTLSMTNTKL